ncbi:probable pectinesterase/pectinesterase inhibitor 7 [Humulus lupulus]|uniref:probable pectinesterase/pectinesterase inhibitor 7 n=1 Tax=Humulus lupulus TaxID=3486 RepID=UPI002B40DFCD|nr:probable pectinesterase/pectinesterase inhibitor 7 [Humulus lupulus]
MGSTTNRKLLLWSSSITILLFLPSFCISFSIDDICSLTQHSSYCTKTLPNNTSTHDIHHYGRFSVQTSLVRSQRFRNSVQRRIILSSSAHNCTQEPMAIRALEDCQELVSSNVNLLESCVVMVNAANQLLPINQAEDLRDSLSAVLTNLYTCLEGLESTPTAETIKNDLSQMINDDVQLHSISLALCTQGWVPKDKKDSSTMPTTPPLPPRQAWSSSLPRFRLVSDKANRQAILESALKGVKVSVDHNGDEQGSITINDFVVVSKDGSWDFTNITDAINAAPNNYNGRAAASDGYFLVYVTAGVYEEYVDVGREKTNVFMLGDGIGQTIISGNHSHADGWPTWSSATLCKYIQPLSH